MELRLIQLSGKAQHTTHTFADRETIAVGRHPDNDLAFDPEADRRVSGRHAELRFNGGAWRLVDLESRNGTFVNGAKVSEADLKDGDEIDFGLGGPRVRVDLGGGTGGAVSAGAGERAGGGRFGSTTMFMHEAVSRAVKESSRNLKMAVGVLSTILVVAVGTLVYQNVTLRDEMNVARDRHRQELKALEGQFGTALSESEARARQLEEQVDAARRDATVGRAQVRALQDMLDEERGRQADLRKAIDDYGKRLAGMGQMSSGALQTIRSFQPVARDNGPSVFMVCGFDPATSRATPVGTAFVVREDGLLITNAHVAAEIQRLQKEMGGQYRGVVLRNGLPGTLLPITELIVHPEYNAGAQYSPDMAALRVDTGGGALRPVRLAAGAALNDITAGQDVAVFGFPGVTMDPNNPIATLSRGAIGRMVNTNYIQHDCQTSGGNSGSPIFNTNGEVVGIHYSGEGNINVFVPVPALDDNNQPIRNPDGTLKMTLGSRRIKQALGINIGVRADVIARFLGTIR